MLLVYLRQHTSYQRVPCSTLHGIIYYLQYAQTYCQRQYLAVYQLSTTALQYICIIYRVCGINAYSLYLAECICCLLGAGLKHTVSVYRSQVPWIYFNMINNTLRASDSTCTLCIRINHNHFLICYRIDYSSCALCIYRCYHCSSNIFKLFKESLCPLRRQKLQRSNSWNMQSLTSLMLHTYT